jgi:ribosomal protein L11 methyltransferase
LNGRQSEIRNPKSEIAMRWAEIIVDTPPESVEAVTAILLEAECHGVSEKASPGGGTRTVVGFFPVSDQFTEMLDDLEQRLMDLPRFGLLAPLDITLKHAEEADWANEWKKYFKPLEIGKRLVIKPSWETYNADPNRVVVEIDPGQAFGTGGHQTTRLCLGALEQYAEPGMVVADIGTGSGILAIAAAKLGASVVHATDIDRLPREIARENVARNGLEGRVFIHEMDAFDAAAHDCDLVVANIIALTVIELTPSIAERLKPGGLFISSGIVDERLPDVLAALDATGFNVLEVREDEIWRAVAARKPGGVMT